MKMIVKSVLNEWRIIVLFLVDIRDFVLCVLGKWESVRFVRRRLDMRRSCGRFSWCWEMLWLFRASLVLVKFVSINYLGIISQGAFRVHKRVRAHKFI